MLKYKLDQLQAAFEERIATQSGISKEDARSHTARLEKEEGNRSQDLKDELKGPSNNYSQHVDYQLQPPLLSLFPPAAPAPLQSALPTPTLV